MKTAITERDRGRMKVLMFIGGSAPSRDAELTVIATGEGGGNTFRAFWAPGYAPCGDADCECRMVCTGWGMTEEEAIADYWEQWEERHPEAANGTR
jgi:hypothetical protein